MCSESTFPYKLLELSPNAVQVVQDEAPTSVPLRELGVGVEEAVRLEPVEKAIRLVDEVGEGHQLRVRLQHFEGVRRRGVAESGRG